MQEAYIELPSDYHTMLTFMVCYHVCLYMQSLHKKISKKKSTPCRDGSMHECMHWLTKYKNKMYHAHSDMHSITWPHYSTTIPT